MVSVTVDQLGQSTDGSQSFQYFTETSFLDGLRDRDDSLAAITADDFETVYGHNPFQHNPFYGQPESVDEIYIFNQRPRATVDDRDRAEAIAGKMEALAADVIKDRIEIKDDQYKRTDISSGNGRKERAWFDDESIRIISQQEVPYKYPFLRDGDTAIFYGEHRGVSPGAYQFQSWDLPAAYQEYLEDRGYEVDTTTARKDSIPDWQHTIETLQAEDIQDDETLSQVLDEVPGWR